MTMQMLYIQSQYWLCNQNYTCILDLCQLARLIAAHDKMKLLLLPLEFWRFAIHTDLTDKQLLIHRRKLVFTVSYNKIPTSFAAIHSLL